MNYKQIENAIKNCEGFKHNGTMTAEHDENLYKIYSYSTLIASKSIDGVTWLNPNRYSMTTARQMGIIKRAWSIL
jgi:hypothetical protein